MTAELSGRRCLVTAGSRGLGAAIARELARCGADVAVNYHHSEGAARALCDELSQLGVRAVPLRADLADPAQAARLVSVSWEAFGGLDIVVNNYGPWTETPFSALPVDEFDRIMDGNVRATFLISRDAGARMKVADGGVIVNVAATDAFERGRSVYGLAKAGVVHLTEALALEYAPEVRVVAVAPGLIADNEDMPRAVAEAELAYTPLKRLVTRAEIAQVVSLLCGPAFAGITGQTIQMDGGARIFHTPPPTNASQP
jgi:NAD(P)-dependent dehydrogenase (short-subunit alcohol dehydrogenase family)